MVRHVRTMANVFPVYMISNVNAMLVLRAQRVKMWIIVNRTLARIMVTAHQILLEMVSSASVLKVTVELLAQMSTHVIPTRARMVNVKK